MKAILTRLAFVGVAGALVLAGCGGGGGGSSAAPASPGPAAGVPAAAGSSWAAALAFVKALAASGDDGAEPLALGDATLATTDTDEPDPGP